MLVGAADDEGQPPGLPDRLAVPEGTSEGGRRMLFKQTHKVPSQEYLSVTIEPSANESRSEEMDLIPVAKGVSLRDALYTLLDRRGLSVSMVNVYQDGPSKKAANLSTDTQKFAGCHFRIKVKEGHVEGHSVTRANSTSSLPTGGQQASWKSSSSLGPRTNSSNTNLREKDAKKMVSGSMAGSQRGRRGGITTDDASDFGQLAFDAQSSWRNSKGRQALGRKTGLLATAYRTDKASQDKEDMRVLTELLNQYALTGIPALSLSVQGQIGGHFEEDTLAMEDSWRQLVNDPEVLDKQCQSQQEALWELLTTEAAYVKTLKVVVELFLCTLCNLQDNGLLNEIDVDRMFSNIVDIFSVNRSFWNTCLFPMLRDSRNQRIPLNPLRLRDGFIRFEERFEPYVKYCLEQQTCLAYIKENRHESVLFKSYVAWCESQKECSRLRFSDLLVKPMQRLTKYPLLLKAILKKTDIAEVRGGLIEMIDGVERFVCNVDARLRQRHELDRLEAIIGRIESYEPFDTSNDEIEKALKEACMLDLTCAMPGCIPQQNRHLLAEVPNIKLRDASSSGKVDVHCLLLTDMLLICKSVGRKGHDKLKVIRQPFVVDRIVVRDLRDASLLLVYMSEYRVATSYLQLFGQEMTLRIFTEQLKKAQEQFGRAQAFAHRHAHTGVVCLPGLGDDDEEDLSLRPSLLTAATRCSPRSSSHSSLVHSHSGSIDMSDPVSTSSQAPTVPCPTPLFGATSGSPQGRATSFELGELHRQDSSCQLDHPDFMHQQRSRSMETRTSSVCVTVTSPRPERRAFLLKGCSPMSMPSSSSSNTLTVSVPFQQQQQLQHFSSGIGEAAAAVAAAAGDRQEFHSSSIQIPAVSAPKTLSPHSPPSPRALQKTQFLQSPNKPPLLKTKNVSGLVTHSNPPSEGPSPVHSLDNSEPLSQSTSSPEHARLPVAVPAVVSAEAPAIPGQETPRTTCPVASSEEIACTKTPTRAAATTSTSSPVDVKRKEDRERPCRDLPPPPPRRAPRPDARRHHTADSFEHLKQSRDASIHKRLSWNCGQQHSETAVPSMVPGGAARVTPQQQMVSDLRSRNQCLSSESVYSSSGVSSTGSLLFSAADEPAGANSASEGYAFPQQTIVINGIDPFEDDPIQEEDETSVADETPQPVPVGRHHPQKTQRPGFNGGSQGTRIKIDISEVKI
ncbi:pleckstrin homology domain-containing family G member 5 [Galendromus occidentalis]|uniref:Pleckstrin homology domain-containing family G member 5 n=1 Tax=Galendromus occidentalis TaxID=34638 RepID=A0AAJ7SFM9_9ACAR|nr:pleckstrin homology domain-containing family G member 5 [Galendromus occidentalis]